MPLRLCLFFTLCVTLLVAGCDSETERGEKPELKESHHEIVAASNKLALQVYANLRSRPGNVVLSPYGISSSLSMLLTGADGATREQILAALEKSFQGEAELHHVQGELLRWLVTKDEDGRPFRLNVANKLWIQDGQDALRSFLEALDRHYGAQPGVVDFVSQPATARKTINDWAADATNNKITHVISPEAITPQTRLILANAVYFKGDWEKAFDKDDTRPQPFFLTADKEIKVPMMSQRGEFGYAHTDSVRVLIMPYRGDELSMLCILPDKKDGLDELEARLDDKTLSRWTTAAAENLVELPVDIPKFKFENGHDLEPALNAVGITVAFDPATADFSRIDGVKRVAGTVGGLFVDQVLQHAMIDVNEEGTEAAAVTTEMKTEVSTEPPDAPHFRADHPFLFLIRENETGLILFLGRVVDPTE